MDVHLNFNVFSLLLFLFQVSASDPDCGVNAMVNYTIGDGFKKMMEFEVKHTTGDICISGTLDFEMRSSYEFPIIATDQGNSFHSFFLRILKLFNNCVKHSFGYANIHIGTERCPVHLRPVLYDDQSNRCWQ